MESSTALAKRLNRSEVYWKNQYNWLLQEGYQLRPRYHPDWQPSEGKEGREDEIRLVTPSVIDAVQVATAQRVVLKRTSKKDHPDEVRILQYFSQKELAEDSRNHCTPLIAVLSPPNDEDTTIFVMPILRQYDSPPFDTVGEAVDFIRQILEGFVFLHEHRVAHRDVKGDNILLDPTALGLTDFHFSSPGRQATDIHRKPKAKFTRTERRPKYYITDFGYSTLYAQDESPWPPSEIPKFASDGSLPELSSGAPCDPFPADVYYVGNWMRLEFVDGDPDNILRPGFDRTFDFLNPIIDAMTKNNPDDRVTMAQALEKFDEIIAGLSSSMVTSWKIMSAAPKSRTEYAVNVRLTKAVSHLLRRFKYLFLRLPPIPSAPPSPSPSVRNDLPDTSKAIGQEVEAPTASPDPKNVTGTVLEGQERLTPPPDETRPKAATPGLLAHSSDGDDPLPTEGAGATSSSSVAPAITISIPSSTL